MTHTTITGKELLEWKEIFIQDRGRWDLTPNFSNLLNKYFLTQEDIKDIEPIKKTLKDLQKRFEELENRKSEGIEQELKEISEQIKAYKKDIAQAIQTALKEIKEAEQKKGNILKEIKELQEQSVKRLDSEILKKIPVQVKPEDLDTLKILKDFHNRGVTDREKGLSNLWADMRETIPKLNLTPKIKFSMLQAIGEPDKLCSVLRNIMDGLRAGLDLNNIITSKKKDNQEQEGEDITEDM